MAEVALTGISVGRMVDNKFERVEVKAGDSLPAWVSKEDKEYLDLEDFDMIVVVKSYTYLDDASLFQYTESRHRPDKFRFVDFARRR